MSIQIERDGPVTIVTIDRKERRNAVDRTTAEALATAFRDFDSDDDARVAVLHGEHGTFCSGADLKAVAEGNINRLEPDGDGPMGPSRMLLDKPVVASISGHAVAGGLELALWCDLRVADKDATLGVFCRRWGVPLIDGGTVRLPRLIGLSHALDLIITGRPIDAEEACRIGLVNRIAEPGTALDEAIQLAHRIADFPQVCMRNDRLSAYEQFGMSLPDALANEFERGLDSMATEALDGAQRFADGAGRHGEFE